VELEMNMVWRTFLEKFRCCGSSMLMVVVWYFEDGLSEPIVGVIMTTVGDYFPATLANRP
jgi:hypothetical protein